MGVIEVASMLCLVTAAFMVVLYGAVIWHTYAGNKNQWLIKVSSILLVSEIFLFGYGFEYRMIRTNGQHGADNIVIFGVSLGLHYSLFNVGHLWLADKY